jgi:glycosyltransferase involved in cell wall biosynthesis
VSGALLQALGAGLPAIVYDIGGLGEVVGRFGAGAVVEPGDVGGMALALQSLLDDEDALAAARRGAEAARDELTWEASAAAHLELYRELL